MEIAELSRTIVEQFWATSYLEWAGVVFGLLSVWFSSRENILVFPTGIISVLIYVYICYHWKLYADMGVNFYFFLMSIWGWYNWSSKGSIPDLKISQNNVRQQLLSIGMFVSFFVFLSLLLDRVTDSDVPYWDSFTTSCFLVAMYLMAKKKIENWIAWIIGDIVATPLYLYKGLVLTSFQYLVFTLIAIYGYVEWRRLLKTQQDSTNVST